MAASKPPGLIYASLLPEAAPTMKRFEALAAGAKGYVDEAASPRSLSRPCGSCTRFVWAPRRVLSIFIERVTSSPGRIFPAGRVTFTDREKRSSELLVVGRSNKEIGSVLGIEERTVKAHVAKLMRKVGVQNRIALQCMRSHIPW